MNNLYNKIIKLGAVYAMILMLVLVSSCKKDWLEAKTDIRLAVPSSIADYYALLDNSTILTTNAPALGQLSIDDQILTTENWLAITDVHERNAYIWNKDFYNAMAKGPDWDEPYRKIYYANTVLEGLDKKVPEGPLEDINNIKGMALYYRALAFYELATVFAKPYSIATDNDLGIPVRLSSDFNLKSTRSTVKETYAQILLDLTNATDLLPKVPKFKTRASKASVYGLLARVYLSMEKYEDAEKFATLCISTYDGKLMDFNTLSTTSNTPISRFNSECIYQNTLVSTVAMAIYGVNPELIALYTDPNDLRKTIFFRVTSSRTSFKGNYNQGTVLFDGLGLDEIYLIRAECLARTNQFNTAMTVLNDLLRTRWKKDGAGVTTYIDKTASTSDEALRTILLERRKELCFRGLRWADLRRLNLDNRFKVTLTRIVNNETYILPPNDPKYVLPIPDNVIQLSGIQQNLR